MADQLEQEQLELEATGAPDVAVDPMGERGPLLRQRQKRLQAST